MYMLKRASQKLQHAGGVPVPGGATDIAQHLLSHGFSTVFPRTKLKKKPLENMGSCFPIR